MLRIFLNTNVPTNLPESPWTQGENYSSTPGGALILELHKTCHSRAPAKEHCAQRRMSANENPHGGGKIAPGTSSLSPEASWPTTIGGKRPFKNNTVLCDERGRLLGEAFFLAPWYLRYSFCRKLGTRVLLLGEVHTLFVTYTI